MKLLILLSLLLIFNLNADRLSNKGLFCILDSKDMKSNLFEAYLFSDNTFISFYLEIIKKDVFIKKSKPESYSINDRYIKLRGLNIDKRKLSYKTMGGVFYCQMLSKKMLIENVKKMQKQKTLF